MNNLSKSAIHVALLNDYKCQTYTKIKKVKYEMPLMDIKLNLI